MALAAGSMKLELPREALARVDELVEKGEFESRVAAVQAAVAELIRDKFPSLEPQYGGC